jgi:hypothetical protein
MATATVPRPTPPTAPGPPPGPSPIAVPTGPVLIPNARLGRLRTLMLSLMAGALAFGILTGVVAFLAGRTTYDSYRKVVEEGARSVDAALDARSALLQHLSQTAAFLADPTCASCPDNAKVDRRAQANATWLVYTEKSRIAWSNITDPTYGESNVYAAVNQAETDYNRQIGAMYAYFDAKQPDLAAQAFIGPGGAREILNQRLLPAFGGLESLKLEAMTADYRAAQQRIEGWRWALVGVTVLLALLLIGGLFAVRRMHYFVSWPLVIGLALGIALTVWLQYRLDAAAADTPVLVHEAYEPVAGIQDLVTVMNQARALENVAVFDNAHAADHLADFNNYAFLINQKLCGVAGVQNCTAKTFLNSAGRLDDAGDDSVVALGVAANSGAGVPPPIIANIHFLHQPELLEALRKAYLDWLTTHEELATDLRDGKDVNAARQLSSTTSAQKFEAVLNAAGNFNVDTRDEFTTIWKRVYTESTLGQGLALAFPLAGLLAAWGLARRRSELFI